MKNPNNVNENPSVYKYRFRPGYYSENFLIEIITNVEKESFLPDFLDAIKTIQPKQVSVEEIWQNDEILVPYNSKYGKFMLSKDVWDLAFIQSDENQECLRRINDLLLQDVRFENIPVKNEDYS